MKGLAVFEMYGVGLSEGVFDKRIGREKVSDEKRMSYVLQGKAMS